MKIRTVAMWAGLGIVTSSAGAFAIPLPDQTLPVQVHPEPKPVQDLSHFTAGETLLVDGRLGHATLGKTGRAETFFFASVTGADSPGLTAPPLNLGIVIDRSGSMKGDRIANAIAAAVGMVERMRDGDSVSVVSFDTEPTVVVPPTLTSAATRASIETAIRTIRLGGDTCISCGLDEGMRQLERTALGSDRVSRMILLSDGATNHGIRDMGGLRGLAGRMRDRGVTISTIGVDVDFDERVMTAIAAEANGQHHFVADPTGLPAVFSQEFDTLLASVAGDAELRVDLPPGVEVDQVFDRAFRREGARIVIPFGTFSAKQEKTVLMKLRVPADREGVQPVVDVKLAYRDLVQRAEGSCGGALAVKVAADPSVVQKGLDPFVAARVERSRTAQTLTEANLLFGQGRLEEARERLRRQEADLDKAEAEAKRSAHHRPVSQPFRGRSLDDDFGSQRQAVAQAEARFAPPPAPKVGGSGGAASAARGAPATTPAAPFGSGSREGRAAVKENEARSFDLLK